MSVTHIGRYEIVSQLGRGAMGIVYLARDPQIEREIALKTVRFDNPADAFKAEESKARFLKEARISGRLQHPHIVTVYDVGEDQGNLYLAMEYVRGGSLAQKLTEATPLSLEDRIRIVAEVAQALGHAHEMGVIHRDVKPANILLSPSLSAKVTDFGIGKLLAGDTELTSTGQMVGSPAYMSPEQIRGEKLDVRSDIFSLGVVLYQTLTGRKPFPADTLTTLVYQILHEQPAEPGGIRTDLQPELNAILKKCLAKNREDRYTDAGELSEELVALIGLQPVLPNSTITQTKSQKNSKHTRVARTQTPSAEASGPQPPSPPPLPPKAGSDTPTIAVDSGKAGLDSAAASSVRAPASNGPMLMLVGGAAVAIMIATAFLVRHRKGGDSGGPVEPTAVPIAALAIPTVTPTPAITPVPEETPAVPVAAVETPVADETPTEVPTKRPRVKATAAVLAVEPTAVPTPTPTRPANISYATKRLVKLDVSPSQARVFLDGKFVGIADDWDNGGGGALFSFTGEGIHRLRFAFPQYKDLIVDVKVTSTAPQDRAEVTAQLEKGVGEGWPGPEGKFGHPDYKSAGAVKFVVEPPETVLSINGKVLGPVSTWEKEPLPFKEMAVYDVQLAAPGYKTKFLRVLISASTDKPEVVVKEKLKKEK